MRKIRRKQMLTVLMGLMGCAVLNIIITSHSRQGTPEEHIQSAPVLPNMNHAESETKPTVGQTVVNFGRNHVTWLEDEKSVEPEQNTQSEEAAGLENDAPRFLPEVPFTLVTGADHQYFRGLSNLVGSVHFWEPRRNIVVYDLGLSASEISEVKKWCRTTLITFDFKNVPKHVSTLKVFAWKPLVIEDAVDRFDKIFWVDAGCDIRGPLTKIDEYLTQDGHFFVQGQDVDMTGYVHHGMFSYLNKKPLEFFSKKPSFAGGVNGWSKHGPAYRTILPEWISCSMKMACISPRGAHLSNHRYDQSALSILIYSSDISVKPHTELLAAGREQLSHSHTNPSSHVVYTARGRNSEYRKHLCSQSKADRSQKKPT